MKEIYVWDFPHGYRPYTVREGNGKNVGTLYVCTEHRGSGPSIRLPDYKGGWFKAAVVPRDYTKAGKHIVLLSDGTVVGGRTKGRALRKARKTEPLYFAREVCEPIKY